MNQIALRKKLGETFINVHRDIMATMPIFVIIACCVGQVDGAIIQYTCVASSPPASALTNDTNEWRNYKIRVRSRENIFCKFLG